MVIKMEVLYNKMIENSDLQKITTIMKKDRNKKEINESTKQAFTIFYNHYVTFNFGQDDHFYSTDILASFDNYLEYITYLIPLFHMLGDTLGYKNGEWEFNLGTNPKEVTAAFTSELIFQFISLGGINDINLRNWKYSDDSILYLATLETAAAHQSSINDFGTALREKYISLIDDLSDRHPGITTMESLKMLRDGIPWNGINYNSMAIGSGTSMRTGGLGIIFCGERNRFKLMSASIEASRITHNSAVAMLGGLTSALFTAFAIENIAINLWPHYLVEYLREDKIDNYLKNSRPKEYPNYQRDKIIFLGKWEKYITLRFNGRDKKTDQKFISNPISRIQFLADKFSRTDQNFFPGACADDSVIIAYDALLECDGSLEKVVVNSILHPGDSDTVGCIALGWFIGYYFSLKNSSIAHRMIVELEKYDYWNRVIRSIMKDNLPKIRNEMLIDTLLFNGEASSELYPFNIWDDTQKEDVTDIEQS